MVENLIDRIYVDTRENKMTVKMKITSDKVIDTSLKKTRKDLSDLWDNPKIKWNNILQTPRRGT